ncbi:MAG: tyrosine-protein phosphatase [Clostridia bacterium]|nr:tyrosine-protein phosphatase [Clostridia bacterium]
MARRFVAALVAALIFATVLGGCVKTEKPKDTVTTGPIGVLKDEDFGNVFFDITIDGFNALGFDFGDSVNVFFDNGRELKDIPYYSGYYVPVGETLILGCPGYPHVAVSINYGAATWEEFGMKDDTKVTVTLNEKGKYKATEEFCALDYSDDRASFASDEMFANFREMKGGNIAAAKFYRSASPCDNRRGRASITNALTEAAGIKFALNLSDNETKYTAHTESEGFDSVYYDNLYKNGGVLLLGLNANYRSDDFARTVSGALLEMTSHGGPCLIHCVDGNDRTGFVCALMLALSGASSDEIVDDYMITYYNYYGITKESDPDMYNAILRDVYSFFYCMCGVDKDADIGSLDLKQGAKNYLKRGDLTDEEIKTAQDYLVKADEAESRIEAVYLGVKDYGAPETNKDNKNDFSYRFMIGGEEQILKIDNGTKDADGNYDYPIQNALKEGYTYYITVEGCKVVSVSEQKEDVVFTPFIKGTPGLKTLGNFLKTALEPVGTTLYVYGGGWDWQDEGASVQARSIGVSPDWVRFFNANDENYTFKEKNGDPELADPTTSYYAYGGYNEYYYAGLDCSGYLGWVIYNTMETESLKDGYVGGSTGFAKRLYGKGWGIWTQDIAFPDGKNGYEMKPGDIMSINGHVWTSLGTCSDGSVVLVHSSPSKSRTGQPGAGVMISAIGTSTDCEAYVLADKYMAKYYPEWYERYPIYLCSPEVYFTFTGKNAGRFSWDVSDSGILKDPDGVQKMTPEEVLKFLFDEK